MNRFHYSRTYTFDTPEGSHKHYFFNLVDRCDTEIKFELVDEDNTATVESDINLDGDTETTKFSFHDTEISLRADRYIPKAYPDNAEGETEEAEDKMQDAHIHTLRNRSEIEHSMACHCISCQRTFKPEEVMDYIDDGETGMCPYCFCDAIIADDSGVEMTDKLLANLHHHFFERLIELHIDDEEYPDFYEVEEEDLPVMMYIHGFRSGANGSKREQLQEYFEGRYRVVAPEVDADPEKSLAAINEIIAQEHPEIIVGTSLGGWMTLMCDSGDAQLVVVNPCPYPEQTLAEWIGQELPYFCERLDGKQTYTLTKEVVDKYANYDVVKNIKEKSSRLHALCSSSDELIGDIHIRTLQPLLPPERLTITNDFGHRCSGAGMEHLFDILEDI
ncbi:MAG: hypothetical protein K2L34_03110 [Muribaculaceae bacterium]|nr:hypothetical protein [Muribaculaceae bacterium]